MLPPISLLYPLLVVAAFALPAGAGAPELTPETFEKTIQHGLWFIEYFSPYCGHCRQFKPTWKELVQDSETEIPQVKLATVNCVLHADLCDTNGVSGYPTLYMYKDGKNVDQFKSNRDLDLLKEFMKKHIPEAEPEPKTITPPPPPPPPPSPPSSPKQPSKPKPSVNLQGEVLPLSPETFSQTLNKGPAFVKFFAPWCGHCKKLAPTWMLLARHMQGKATIADVNCEEHQSLCKSQNIQGYPTLVWFGRGEDAVGRSEYISGRKLEQLKAFVDKASAVGVVALQKDEEIDVHIAQEEVVYLLLHRPQDEIITQSVKEASVPLLGSPPIVASSSSHLFDRFSIPPSIPWAIVAIKDHDASIPSSVFYGKASPRTAAAAADAQLRRWLLAHRLPTSLELTQDTFQNVMNAPHAPLVVIAAVSDGAMKEKVEQRLRDLAKKWRVRTEGSGVVHGRDVVWTLMDKTRWGQWLKSMYGIRKDDQESDLDGVKVVIADHRKLIYYDTDKAGASLNFMSSSSLFSAVEDAASGKTRYKNSENFVERLARMLNNKLKVVEDFLIVHPIKSVFFGLTFITGFLYMVYRLARGSNSYEPWKEERAKNARLD